jgi:hypothetical protein
MIEHTRSQDSKSSANLRSSIAAIFIHTLTRERSSAHQRDRAHSQERQQLQQFRRFLVLFVSFFFFSFSFFILFKNKKLEMIIVYVGYLHVKK